MLRALLAVLVLSVACSSPDPIRDTTRDFLREVVACLENHRDEMVRLGYQYEQVRQRID